MTTTEDRMRRFRENLMSQAESTTLSDAIARLTGLQNGLVESLDGVSSSQAAFKPAAEEWSINEAVSHLRTANSRALEALEKALSGQSAEFNPRGPASNEAVDAMALAREDSQVTMRILGTLPPGGEPDVPVTMNYLGTLSVKACLLFLGNHVADHAKQVGNIKAHSEYPQA